jgi:uncharacterized protein (TIGR02246 family)
MRLIRKATLALFALGITLCCPRARASDEDSVRAIVNGEAAAWTKFDAKAVASFYASDATWQNPFGVRFRTSADLEKFLTRLFQRPGYRSQKEVELPKITDVHFPSPTVAVVWSEEKSEGQIDDETHKPMLPRHSHYLEVLAKTDSGWKITECIIMDELPSP